MFGGVFHDFLQGPWEEVRGYLIEELEQLQNAIASQWSKAFGTDGLLNSDAIDGNATTAGVVYVSNEGAGGSPKWAKVNVNTGVKNRLKFANFVASNNGNTIVGKNLTGAGDFQEIIVGDALQILSTDLDVKVDGVTIQVNGSNQLEVITTAPGLGGGHLHGLMRTVGDGATTTFDLLDTAEYLEHIAVNGSIVDPATFTLSADGTQIVFDVAPTAGNVIALEYVIAQA